MMNLLSDKMKIFGWEFDWPLESALFWLLIVQVALIMFMVIVFAVLIKRVGTHKIVLDEKPRTLTGISLDLSMVKRKFAVGEPFNAEGLIVTANYNRDPMSEPISKFAIFTPETLEALQQQGAVEVCYLLSVDTSVEGKQSVSVYYKGQEAAYTISVGEQEEAPVVTVVTVPQQVEEVPQRRLVGVTLNTDAVCRNFQQGDEFNCDGLTVLAQYSLEPTEEVVSEWTALTREQFDNLPQGMEEGVCYVITPDLRESGTKFVDVRLGEFVSSYSVDVAELQPEPEPEPQPEPQPKPILFDDEEDREPVGISIDVRVVQREFNVGDEFDCEGLLITANFDKDPLTESIVDYSVVDEELFHRIASTSEIAGCYVIKPDLTKVGKQVVTVRYEKFTAYYTIAVGQPEEEAEPERTLLYISADTENVQKDYFEGDALNCKGLVVTAHFNVEPLEVIVDDFSVVSPDMNVVGSPTVSVQYQDRTVGFRININPLPEEERKKREPVIIEEESFEARLRYDKSFTARLIQSDDEVKFWYNDIKNELLSYAKTKARISWKRETFKAAKEVVAKISFRGKTLCLFLALNAADYADTKYQLEDVSDIPSNVDTPAMYRLKSAKRIKYAMDLISFTMEKFGVQRIDRIAEDYYMPYEGVVELIKKGLVKRDIKTAADEAIFEQGKAQAEQAEQPVEIAPGMFVTTKSADEKEREVAATESEQSAETEQTPNDANPEN